MKKLIEITVKLLREKYSLVHTSICMLEQDILSKS